jgi:hypothetical protein
MPFALARTRRDGDPTAIVFWDIPNFDSHKIKGIRCGKQIYDDTARLYIFSDREQMALCDICDWPRGFGGRIPLGIRTPGARFGAVPPLKS